MADLYENILNALANKVRVDILKLLSKDGKASFTEIMERLRMDPKSEAGKFGYHLRLLMKANLITLDESTGKYVLTDLGRQVAEYMWSIEEAARIKTGEMLVRTSSLTIEPFDRRKIAEVLVREANAPRTLADAISKEAEERLSKLQIKYLTAALIREFVNAILLEKGLEEYRHSLTRLGLPVYDTTELIKNASRMVLPSPESVHKLAGDSVFEEYTLLKALPRSIGDAHLAGVLHFNNSQYFVLRIANIQHDLRIFLKNGLMPDGSGIYLPVHKPPTTLKEALTIASNLVSATQHYVSSSQAIDMFNVFIAPYADGMSYEDVKSLIYDFIQDLNTNQDYRRCVQPIALGLELGIPKFLEGERAVGRGGTYGDFEDAALMLLNALLDVMLEGDGSGKPFISPQLVIKLRREHVKTEVQEVLLKACELASKWGSIYFVNMYQGWQGVNVSVCGDLSRLDSEWKNDWELGCLRTGILDNVTVNLPRIALEAKGDDDIFLERLEELLDLCYEALTIKRKIIEERIAIDGIMPFMGQVVNGDVYYHLENSSLLISYVGLPEAIAYHTGLDLTDSSALSFAKKIVQTMSSYAQHAKAGDRLVISNLTFEPVSSRLTKLDLKSAHRSIGKRKEAPPIYTEFSNTPPYQVLPLRKRVEIEEVFHQMLKGGHLLEIKLAEPSPSAKSLNEFIRKVVESNVGFFCFSRDYTVCNICGNIVGGLKEKCSKCGHSGYKLVKFSRVNGLYKPSSLWSEDDKWLVYNSQRYML
ncbi:MAG: anaerobic ribonucleoside-triphosphate reductase [Candidatus Methanomethylicota archaeon]|uniref:Anaerobic ribonucleoside-triphosphate reductase n=2 Tax=Thermoproteota archaeon TaxID=2056631 RepID=A0A497EUB3_9CREN|nr:MAG: anaerobic ribonucleoside-triphosphate reductase [Candidatus Verstraetearchaeota archaeon]